MAPLTASETFVYSATHINYAPTISSFVDHTVNENTSLDPIPFTVGDVETAASSLMVTATSSDTGGSFQQANIILDREQGRDGH